MATRARIARQYEDGHIRTIYSHWDGYPEHVGHILLHHYQSPAKIEALLDLGNVSMLGQELGSQHPFAGFNNPIGLDGIGHVFCTFYGRDRGDRDEFAEVFKDVDALIEADIFEEYFYLFGPDGVWYVAQGSNLDGSRPLQGVVHPPCVPVVATLSF